MKKYIFSVDECDEEIYDNLIEKPYTMLLIISESNLKDYKKNGFSQMEKFVEVCKSRNVKSFLFVYCPFLDASMKKSKGLESKI